VCLNQKEVIMLFSIIIPTYNREKLIGFAINSVIEQEFTDWELIIIDDGSTDSTKEVIEPYLKDERVKYIFQKNAERSTARNNGILKSKGQYICFLDSDDTFLNNHLLTFHEFIKNTENIGFIYSLKKGDKFISRKNKFGQVFLSDIHSQQVCIKRNFFDKDLFDPKINIGEDRELWMRIILNTDIKCTLTPTVVIIDHDDRSIHLKHSAPVFKNRTLINQLSKSYKNNLSKKVIRLKKSHAEFSIFKHFIYTDKKLKALKYLIRSIVKDPFNSWNKHKFIILLTLFKIYPKRGISEYIKK